MKKLFVVSILLFNFMLVDFANAENLLQAYKDASKSNILKADLAKLYKAYGKKDQAMSYILPHIGFNGTYAYYWAESLKYDWKEGKSSDKKTFDGYGNFNLNIEISQVLFDSRAVLGFVAANRGAQAAELVYDNAEQTLILNTVKAYFNILRSEDLLSSMNAEEAAIRKQLDVINQRYKSGLANITNLYEVQAAYDKIRSARIGAETMVMSSYGDLRQITEKEYKNLSSLKNKFNLISPYPDDENYWEKKSLENNLNLKAAQKQVDATTIAKHPHFYPSLSLFARYGFENNAKGSDTVAHNFVAGLRFSMDIYNGGKSFADAKADSAQWLDSIANLEIAKRRIGYGAKTLFHKVKTDIVKVEATQQAVKSNKSALDATKSSYESGLRSVIDLLNAEKNLYAAMREYSDARYDYIIDYLELKAMIGDLNEQDIKTFNSWLVDRNITN